MKPVNKLDDIWEFEIFIQNIINSARGMSFKLLLKWEDNNYLPTLRRNPSSISRTFRLQVTCVYFIVLLVGQDILWTLLVEQVLFRPEIASS